MGYGKLEHSIIRFRNLLEELMVGKGGLLEGEGWYRAMRRVGDKAVSTQLQELIIKILLSSRKLNYCGTVVTPVGICKGLLSSGKKMPSM